MFYRKIDDEERDKMREKEYVKNLKGLWNGLRILGSASTGDSFTDKEIRRVIGEWNVDGTSEGWDDFLEEWL